MKNDLRLRAAELSDIETLGAIERASASRFLGTDRAWLAADDPTDAGTLAERVCDGGLLVACDGTLLVAFIMFREAEGCGYIEQVDVLTSHERRGHCQPKCTGQ